MTSGWRIASVVVAATNEGVAAFLRGLEARGFKEAVKSYAQARLDGPEECGLLAASVELFGTAERLCHHLQETVLASLEHPPAVQAGKPSP